jgi:hypothetical protein
MKGTLSIDELPFLFTNSGSRALHAVPEFAGCADRGSETQCSHKTLSIADNDNLIWRRARHDGGHEVVRVLELSVWGWSFGGL